MKAKQFVKDYTLATTACKVFEENKAENILLIDVSYLSNIADYFVIATANSTIHAKSLVEHIEDALEKKGEKVYRRDGAGDGRWLVLDFGTLIVHIFTPEIREFYHLEKLWNDGKNTLNMAGINKLIEKADLESKKAQAESESDKIETVVKSEDDLKKENKKAKENKKVKEIDRSQNNEKLIILAENEVAQNGENDSEKKE